MLIPDILLAYDGRVEMLRYCFGGGDDEEIGRPLDDFDSFGKAFINAGQQ